jgi:hypothetical protein
MPFLFMLQVRLRFSVSLWSFSLSLSLSLSLSFSLFFSSISLSFFLSPSCSLCLFYSLSIFLTLFFSPLVSLFVSLSLSHASGVCWTLVYDTLYGYQDRKDDKKLGLKSTSLHLGDKPQIALTGIASGMIGGLTLTGYNSELSAPFYAGVVMVRVSSFFFSLERTDRSFNLSLNLSLNLDLDLYLSFLFYYVSNFLFIYLILFLSIFKVGGQLLWQIWTADLNNSKNLWQRFNSNKYTGAVVTAAIIAGHF